MMKWLAAVLIVVTISYIELQYAYAHYPNTQRWKSGLFATGSLGIGLILVLFAGPLTDILDIVIGLAISALGGVATTWLFPRRIKKVIPPKR